MCRLTFDGQELVSSTGVLHSRMAAGPLALAEWGAMKCWTKGLDSGRVLLCERRKFNYPSFSATFYLPEKLSVSGWAPVLYAEAEFPGSLSSTSAGKTLFLPETLNCSCQPVHTMQGSESDVV